MAKPTTDFPNMMINEHPVWIKVDPTQNRFAFWQLGYWNIWDLEQLPKALKTNAENPEKRFAPYVSSYNKVHPFPEAIWDDGKDLLEPQPEGEGENKGKIVTQAVKKANEDEAEEEKEEEPKKEEEKEAPAAEEEEEKDAAKAEEPKKKRWVTYKRNPAHHPTAPGVKAHKEHEKVQDVRDKTLQKVMVAVKKISS